MRGRDLPFAIETADSRRFVMPLLLAAGCLAPDSARAQILRGRVVADTAGVIGARVTARDTADWRTEVETDSTGVFAIELPHAGTFLVDATLAGSGVAGPDAVIVEAREEVLVTIRLDAPVTLEPIEVNSRRLYGPNVTRAGLEERWATARTFGLGAVFTRDDLDARPTVYVHDIVRSLPGVYLVQGQGFVRVQFRKSGDVCYPQVWVDGVRDVDGQSMLDRLDPDDLEAIEVYRRASFAPPEYIDDTGCGSILAWTRRDTRGGSPLTWRRVAAFFGLVALTLFLRNNYY